MSESYCRSLSRTYWVLALLAVVTWICHSSVNRKFSKMMVGMQQVATLQRGMQMEEFQLFHNYRQSSALRLASRRHVQEAYAKEYDALQVLGRLRSDEADAALVHDEAEELWNDADEDEKRASNLAYASTEDRLDYVASKLKGTSMEKQAEQEAAEASDRLKGAEELEKQGFAKLHEAEVRLNGTGTDSDTIAHVVASDQGICQWLPWACKGVEKSAPVDPNKKVTNEAISLANEFRESLKLIDQAKKEREFAVELLHRSSEDVNQSIALLERAVRLHEKAAQEHLEAVEVYENAKEEEEQAKKDEMIGALEDREVALDKIRLIGDLNSMSQFAVQAREESQNATALDFQCKNEQAKIVETELRIRETTFAAKRHVAHAGWIALFAVLLAVTLLVLAIFRIVNAFQTSEPMSWLLGNPKLEIRDVSYICLHFLFLLLTLGFSGQLLVDYHKHGILGRVEIVILFALAGSFFQVTLLHFLPNVIRLVFLSSLKWNMLMTLLIENVGKSSIIVVAVFIFEILLLWVNFGTIVFSQTYKWNGFWLWGFTTIAGLLHVFCCESYRRTGSSLGSDSSMMTMMTTVEIEEGTELISLESCANSIPASMQSVDLDSPGPSRSKDRPAPITYGSTSLGSITTFAPEIAATFISSWSTQVTRLMVLFDSLLASWAIWVARHNISVIFKLSPLSAGIVWGFFPMWVLGVVLVLSLVACLFSFWEWKRRKQQEKAFEFLDTQMGGSHALRERSTAPLLG